MPATCAATGLTEGSHCPVCDEVLVARQTVPAKGHDYTAAITPPACEKKGFTAFTCKRCGDSFRSDRTGSLGHRYGAWICNGDGDHSAACLRGSCGHAMKTACTYCELTLGAQTLRICPVCGDAGDIPFEAVIGADAAVVVGGILPSPLVFASLRPFGKEPVSVPGMPEGEAKVLLAFTVAYEFAGQSEAFMGNLSILLPEEDWADFMLVQPGENGGWVEIPWTFENGTLSFQTDAGGLFLILANK